MIYFFTKGGREVGSSRQRAFLIAEELTLIGFETRVCEPSIDDISRTPWPKKLSLIQSISTQLFSIKNNEIIYLQRAIGNKYFLLLVFLRKIFGGPKIIFDFDDAIYKHSWWKTHLLVKLSNLVVVGSHSLYDWSKKYKDNVIILPTSVRVDDYQKYSRYLRPSNKKVNIGWIGAGSAHVNNLKILVPVFKKMVEQNKEFVFTIVGAGDQEGLRAMFKGISGLEVIFYDPKDWGEESIAAKIIQNFDIGIMPLVDDEWNRSKCAFKSIEYMACGVVPVLSPVGENNFLVQHGVDGYFADKTENWIDKLNQLIDDSRLVESMGRQAQKKIEDKYSLKNNAKELAKIIQNLT